MIDADQASTSTRMSVDQPKAPIRYVALVGTGIALNLGLGTMVHAVGLPVYVDAVGTLVVTLLVGIPSGIACGVLSFLIGGVLTNPVLPYFSGTQAAIAIAVGVMANHGWYRGVAGRVACGVGLGAIAGLVSAPVIVILFGGITGSGASMVAALLMASGKKVIESVVLSGLASEPLDKTIQTLIAVWLITRLPTTILRRYDNRRLRMNGWLREVEVKSVK